MSNNWVISRIGLINFWFYDNEEFHFADGRLLLRGSNGSGKSVTMQSFIPLLLDGNKSPERLDPFGSRARKLDNYLLGEDNNQREENTGYLFMEFVKHDSGNHITIGMGLRARKNKNLDFWGFAITDGRRIGEDFYLFKDLGEKIPLSKNELRNKLGDGGELYTSQRDYMTMVNKYLFGYETIEDYEQLIKLLIQIRTPKLSKEFKPTVIYEIMNNSLQPLSDDDLRPMSEAIENMDNIKDQLEHLKESKRAGDSLKREYDKYNRFILLHKSRALLQSLSELEEKQKQNDELIVNIKDFQRKIESITSNIDALKMDRTDIEHKKDQLGKHESIEALNELIKLQEEIKSFADDLDKKEKSQEEKSKKQRDLSYKKKDTVETIASKEIELENKLEEMTDLVDGLYFDEHFFFLKELRENFSDGYNFPLFRQDVDKYRARLENGRKALENEKAKNSLHEKALGELEKARREKGTKEIELNKAQEVLDEKREELIENAYDWERENIHLKLKEDTMHRVQRCINHYGDTNNYDDILSVVRDDYALIETGFNDEINSITVKKQLLQKEKDKFEAELDEWLNQKDPQPLRENKVINNRFNLKYNGIPYIPFYMAVDFKENVDEHFKGILEESLIDMGLLDAIIIPPEYKDKILSVEGDTGDRYLFPSKSKHGRNLSEFLTPISDANTGVSNECIQNVLESILFEDINSNSDFANSTYISNAGAYGIGVLTGSTSQIYTPKFLGIQSRILYRQENIERLQSLIEKLNNEINEKIYDIQIIEGYKEILNSEFKAFPNKNDIETSLSIVKELELELSSKLNEIDKLSKAEAEAYKELRIAKEAVIEATSKLELSLVLSVYEEAVHSINEYRDILSDVQTVAGNLSGAMRELINLDSQIQDLEADLDDIRAEIRDINRKIEERSRKKTTFEEILNRPDSKEIAEKLQLYTARLKEIPDEIEKMAATKAALEENEKMSTKNLDTMKETLKALQQKYDYCKKVFGEEYQLGYVFSDPSDNLNVLAKSVFSELKQDEKLKKQIDEYITSLQGKFHENQQYLTEYHVSIEHIFEASALSNDNVSESDSLTETRYDGILRQRLQLNARINGKISSFYTLIDYVSQAIEENESLLKESDRQIFEEILADTVGKKIRSRINSSQEWVKRMNKLMEDMNTSSGLSFSLSWRSKTADVEGQLDTKVLVDILRSDSQLLSEEQMSSLSTHFRSKIQQAFKANDETNVQLSYHAIMKEALDYRKWFEFQLSYTKTREGKKELTDNAFFKFSGGEKAMAMYVPLFSSVYARYEGARKDCPKIISLDEAFAGVDETNIRDMFRLVEDLRLSFIINSQVLWGDYDTLPELSICELLRPNNADFVSVMRYHWNGKVKTLVNNC